MKQGLVLHKLIDKVSKKISLWFFKQRLPVSYIIFNILYKKFIINQNINDEIILKFHKSGFAKLKINLKSEVELFKKKFFIKDEDKDIKDKRVKLNLNDHDKKQFAEIIKTKLKPAINSLENYFNCDVYISDILPFRIYNIEDKDNLQRESYANHFHQDGYLMIYNKIFINLMDVNNEDGPLEIIPIENKKYFFKSFKYKDRNNYNTSGDQNLIYKNTGEMGDCFLFSSPQIFHRAGVPKYFRDIIQIIIVTIPKNYSEGIKLEDEKKLFEGNEKNIMKVSKPYGVMSILRLYTIFFKRKLKGV